ncbi:MAG TPA: hypothetical protein VLT36_17270 [Candidatus Dormibacteraeota bacterium]|nr:hypothetical protein [Candidatus Dormibacteraeota bacterium]
MGVVREYGLFLFQSLIQVCWYAVIFGTFAFTLAGGVELCVFGYTVPLRFIGLPAIMIGLLVTGVSLWFVAELIRPGATMEQDVSEQREVFATPEASSSVWSFLFFDAAILAVLYLLTLWPPYWCRIFPLSGAQRTVYYVVSWVRVCLRVMSGRANLKPEETVFFWAIMSLLSIAVWVMVYFALATLRRAKLRKNAPRPKTGRDVTTEFVEALRRRGVSKDDARKCVSALLRPERRSQPAYDQIEYVDFLVQQARHRDQTLTYPNLYLTHLNENIPVPPEFKTRFKRQKLEQ